MERKAKIWEVCSSWKPQDVSSKQMRFVLVDKKNQVIYGEVPKSASTNWLYTIINQTGKVKVNFNDLSKNKFAFVNRSFLKGIQIHYINEFGMGCAEITLINQKIHLQSSIYLINTLSPSVTL